MTEILCIGSVLWDMIGRSEAPMMAGADRPGRISRRPGGVALNIAIALRKFGLSPILLSAVGRDAQGDELLERCRELGLETGYMYRAQDLPTDRYMAIEAAGDLMAAIADARTLEAVGDKILDPLKIGPLGTKASPYAGAVVLDGNLTETLLDHISESTLLGAADLRVAPASPGKAMRLKPFLLRGRATLYVNLEEASLLADQDFRTAIEAAEHLVELGALRVVVTHSEKSACDASSNGSVSGDPPCVEPRQITGAGDMFMAAHIATELGGMDRTSSLTCALHSAAAHVSGAKI